MSCKPTYAAQRQAMSRERECKLVRFNQHLLILLDSAQLWQTVMNLVSRLLVEESWRAKRASRPRPDALVSVINQGAQRFDKGTLAKTVNRHLSHSESMTATTANPLRLCLKRRGLLQNQKACLTLPSVKKDHESNRGAAARNHAISHHEKAGRTPAS